MSTAKMVLDGLAEAGGSPVKGIADLKPGDNVMFKSGHPLEGLVGFIVQIHPEASTVDLKFGKGTRMAVPISDLLKLEGTHNIGSPTVKVAAVAAV